MNLLVERNHGDSGEALTELPPLRRHNGFGPSIWPFLFTVRFKPTFPHQDGTVTLAIDHSDDGDDWTEIATFDSGTSDARILKASSTVDEPKPNLRIRWEIDAGYWDILVDARRDVQRGLALGF